MFDVISIKFFEGDPSNNELPFKENQLISVTGSIDENNYMGQYTIPGTNEVRSGKFPKSCVEVLSENIDDNLDSPNVPEMSIRDRIASMLKQQEAEIHLTEQHSSIEEVDSNKDAEIEQIKVSESELTDNEGEDDFENPDTNDDNNESAEAARKQSLVERMARLSGAGRPGANGFNPFGMPLPVSLKSSTQEHIESIYDDKKEDIEDLSKKRQFNIMTGEWMDVNTFNHSFKPQKSESAEIKETSPIDDNQSNDDIRRQNIEIDKDDVENFSDTEASSNDPQSKENVFHELKAQETAHVEPEIHSKTEIKQLDSPQVPTKTNDVLENSRSIPKPGPVYIVPDVPRTMDITGETSKNPPLAPASTRISKTAPPPIPTMTAPSTTKLPPTIPTPSVPVVTPLVETADDHSNSSKQPSTEVESEITVSTTIPKIPNNMSPPPPIPTSMKPSQSSDISSSPVAFKSPPPVPPSTKPPQIEGISTSPGNFKAPPPIPPIMKPPQIEGISTSPGTFKAPHPVPNALPKLKSEVAEEGNLSKGDTMKKEHISLSKERLLMNSSFANTRDNDSTISQKVFFFDESKNNVELETTFRKTYKNACLMNVSDGNEWLLVDGLVPESAIVSVDGKLQKYVVQKEIHDVRLDTIGEIVSIVAMRILFEDYSYLDVKLLFNKEKNQIEYSKQTFVFTHTKEHSFLEGLSALAVTLEKEAMATVGNKTELVDSVRWVDDLLQRNNFVEVLGERTFGVNIIKYDPHKGKLNVETNVEIGDILVIKDGDYADGILESLIICSVDDKNYSFKCITIDSNGEIIIVGRNFSNMTRGKVRVFRPVPKGIL